MAMPAYQAGKTIEDVFRRIPSETARRLYRILVVDDGSRDDTAAAIGRLAGRWPCLVPLRHQTNRGYGAAIKTLLTAARCEEADAVIVVHADGQYAPERIPDLLAPLDDGAADLVQGSRLLGGGARAGGMPLYKYVANRALTRIENAVFGLRLAEYHSGYLAYARSFLDAVAFEGFSDSFDFDLEMMAAARAGGYRIREVPIPTRYAGETSHLRSIPYGLRVLRVVIRYLRGHYRARVRPAPTVGLLTRREAAG
jgi:glycosyltransferase involved in cell wall biosynthesis